MLSNENLNEAFNLLWCDMNAPWWWLNLHKTNAANEKLVIRLVYGHWVQDGYRLFPYYNSLSNKMDNRIQLYVWMGRRFWQDERNYVVLIPQRGTRDAGRKAFGGVDCERDWDNKILKVSNFVDKKWSIFAILMWYNYDERIGFKAAKECIWYKR